MINKSMSHVINIGHNGGAVWKLHGISANKLQTNLGDSIIIIVFPVH